jgi:[citrate (pro-3S)-lyase] ligase
VPGTDLVERPVDLKNRREVAAVSAFLAGFDLGYDETGDYTVVISDNEKIVATGSLAGEVLRNIAVAGEEQGEGLTAKIVTNLMRQAAQMGRFHYFLYTKPGMAAIFSSLGFREVSRAEPYAVLLEAGLGTIDDYCREISQIVEALPIGRRAALVVNCNPFTRGHQAIIQKAAAENDAVIVLVVEEDKSVFPFTVRLELVRQGLRHCRNVMVVPGGKYAVSAATFPAYFTRGQAAVEAQTRLDATIFAEHIAPSLSVTKRYVGEEPHSEITRAYNQALRQILPCFGVELVVVPRFKTGGEVISASAVREAIRQDEWERVYRLVPDTTFRFLRSPRAVGVVAAIKQPSIGH